MPPCQSKENESDIEAALLTYIPAGADPKNHCVKMIQQCTDAACANEETSSRRRDKRTWLRKTWYLFGVAFLVALGLLGLHRKGVFHFAWEIGVYMTRVLFKNILFAFFAYIRDLGNWGAVILSLVYALCTVLFIPVTVLNLAAGFCFGVFTGFISVSTGGILGASLAFLAGRYCLRGWVRRLMDGDKTNFSMVDAMLRRSEANTFRIVLLSRLPPCLPFPCVNYSYALTDVSFITYFWATWIGLMPGTFVYVYMGSALRNLADVVSGSAQSSKASMFLLLLGAIATLLVLVYIMREAQRTIESGAQGVELNGTGTPINSSARTPPHDATSPRQRKNSSPFTINLSDNIDEDESDDKDDVAERALDREGEWLLFTATKSTKPSRSRQRTLTRNSSIWSLFNQDPKNAGSRHRKADRRLEYFL